MEPEFDALPRSLNSGKAFLRTMTRRISWHVKRSNCA
jgi:hypothetical protein